MFLHAFSPCTNHLLTNRDLLFIESMNVPWGFCQRWAALLLHVDMFTDGLSLQLVEFNVLSMYYCNFKILAPQIYQNHPVCEWSNENSFWCHSSNSQEYYRGRDLRSFLSNQLWTADKGTFWRVSCKHLIIFFLCALWPCFFFIMLRR